MKKIYIIDGNSYIHRAYHALKPLSTKEGFPTHAIYGFTKMLIKLLETNPDGIIVVFDVAKKSFRNDIYPEYKANRPPMDDSLVVQIPFIKEIVKGFNIPIIEKEDVEADDVIASLTERFKNKDYEVVIISGDKDLMCLIDDNVKMWDTMKDVVYDKNSVAKKFGVPKEYITDFLALVGDKIDNIPGVKGIGEKTAKELINKFGSIENIYDSIDKIEKDRLRKILLENKENAFLSKRLVQLKYDLDIEINENEIKLKAPDFEKLKKIFKQLEFESLLEKFGLSLDDEFIKYSLIKDFPKGNTISFYGEKYKDLFGEKVFYGVTEDGKGVYLSDDLKKLKNLEKKKVIFYHYKEVSKRFNFSFSNEDFDDILLMAYLIDPERNLSIESLSFYFIDEKIKPIDAYKEKKNVKINFALLKDEDKKRFISERVSAIHRIYLKLIDNLKKENKLNNLYNKLDKPLIHVLKKMERNGILIDVGFLKELNREVSKEIEELTKKIYEVAGVKFNINSTKQLREILFDKLGLEVIKKTKTGPSTDNEVLMELSAVHELPKLILEYREKVKLKSTYIDSLLEIVDKNTRRIYPTFHQTVTATGRLSCSNPNVQNIPIRGEQGALVRKAFIAPEGEKIVAIDYSQIELRIFAHYSQDKTLIEAFKNGLDVHSLTASKIYQVTMEKVDDLMRREGKTINFSIIYGISPYGLSKALRISREKAKIFIENYFKEYPMVKEFIEKTIEHVKQTGYVENYYGRRRYIRGLDSRSHNEREFAKRAAINTIIQGTAADVMKFAMLEVDKIVDEYNAKMIMQIHDELIFEVPEDKAEKFAEKVKNIMENVVKLTVPLIADVGIADNWYEAH